MKISPAPLIATLAAIVCIGLVISYNGKKMADNENAPKRPAAKAVAPSVSVIDAKPSTYTAYVSGHGAAVAHWSLTLKAQVQGEVMSMSDEFATGRLISNGDILANIDNTEYLQAQANAKATLAEANLALQEEKDLGSQVKREWDRSGLTQAPSSPLVFRSLQLEAAQATADNARYALKKAQRDEKNTHVRAPFDAVILSRDISLGSYVNIGDTLATLNSTDKVEITVPLSLVQWQNLSQDKTSKVSLTDVTTHTQWQGYIARFEQHLDDSSRQRSVVVALDNPFAQTPALLPGTFLSVEIEGKTLSHVIKLPASAISQEGLIWYVNEHKELKSLVAHKVFERGDAVYIHSIDDLSNAQIVVRPLVSYLSGMQVNPVIEGQVQ